MAEDPEWPMKSMSSEVARGVRVTHCGMGRVRRACEEVRGGLMEGREGRAERVCGQFCRASWRTEKVR